MEEVALGLRHWGWGKMLTQLTLLVLDKWWGAENLE